MGDKTGISWTDATWNPIRGCSKVSEGCRNCYAMHVAARFSGPEQPYHGLALRLPARWTGKVRLVPEHLDDPLRWRRPRRIFVNSMSDLFHEALSNEAIAAVFGVMAAAPRHQFQVLTKRPKRMLEWFKWVERFAPTCNGGRGMSESAFCVCHAQTAFDAMPDDPNKLRPLWSGNTRAACVRPWPLPNVWLGVSVEDQATADERIPELLATPAALHWVSVEPQLGPVDMSRYMWPVCEQWPSKYMTPEEARADGHETTKRRQRLVSAHSAFINWVVQGGESGHNARPFDLAWAESMRDQCKAASVPWFMKQMGEEWACAHHASSRHGSDPSEWPEALRVQEFPR